MVIRHRTEEEDKLPRQAHALALKVSEIVWRSNPTTRVDVKRRSDHSYRRRSLSLRRGLLTRPIEQCHLLSPMLMGDDFNNLAFCGDPRVSRKRAGSEPND